MSLTLNDLASLAVLVEELNVSTDNHDAITAITTFLKGANPHSLTKSAVVDLAEVLKDHLDTMTGNEEEEHSFFLPKYRNKSLKGKLWKKCPKCGDSYYKTNCLTPSIHSL